jgi:hypothetical protein
VCKSYQLIKQLATNIIMVLGWTLIVCFISSKKKKRLVFNKDTLD